MRLARIVSAAVLATLLGGTAAAVEIKVEMLNRDKAANISNVFTGAAGCRKVVPQGRPKIAQRFIAGLGVGSQKVPQGRKNPPLGLGSGRA